MNPGHHPLNDDTDGSTAVRSLLGAVRRRLWLERLVVAARVALWSWAAILAIAAALHLALGRPDLAVALLVATAAGLAALGWAALQGPGERDAALFADRQLGGESAYSTWLEARTDAGPVHDTPALRRLAQWIAATVPRSRSALGSLHLPLRLARPLAAAAICTVVAALVTALPAAQRNDGVELPRQGRESSEQAEAPSLDDDALARELAAELSAPRNSPDGSAAPRRGSMQRTRDGDAATSTAAAGDPRTAQAGTSRDDARPATVAAAPVEAAGVDAATGAPLAADQAGEAGTASVRGSGREAGTSRDELAAEAGSRALRGALAVQRREVIRPVEDSARQADMGQAGFYDGDASTGGEVAVFSGAAAARPPAARREIELTPAEAAYATAWAETARSMRTQPR
jgi:hypothetical protein